MPYGPQKLPTYRRIHYDGFYREQEKHSIRRSMAESITSTGPTHGLTHIPKRIEVAGLGGFRPTDHHPARDSREGLGERTTRRHVQRGQSSG